MRLARILFALGTLVAVPTASFAEDADGELYVVGYDGAIYTVGLRAPH